MGPVAENLKVAVVLVKNIELFAGPWVINVSNRGFVGVRSSWLKYVSCVPEGGASHPSLPRTPWKLKGESGRSRREAKKPIAKIMRTGIKRYCMIFLLYHFLLQCGHESRTKFPGASPVRNRECLQRSISYGTRAFLSGNIEGDNKLNFVRDEDSSDQNA